MGLGQHLLHGATETLVLLGVIVLQANLELHCLPEAPLLGFRALEHGIYALVQCITVHLAVKIKVTL